MGRKWPEIGRRIGASALDTLMPPKCVSCGGIAGEGPFPHVCPCCSGRIRIIEDPRCATCGYPVFGENEGVTCCSHCEGLEAKFGEGRSICLFQGPVRELVYALKYENGLWALRDIRSIAAQTEDLFRYLYDSVLVPVPLHPKKERDRGYNQSELIAEEIACEFGIRSAPRLLQRVEDTESQTRFNRAERRGNLRNAFAMRRKAVIEPGVRYILIDDVFTTGSTLNACAGILRRAGAEAVDALTVGHG